LSGINGLQGNQNTDSGTSEFNAQSFLIESILSKVNTCTLVKIHAVSNNDTTDPVGFVDVVPMVNQIDGAGNIVPHGIIYHCCYSRMQGGTNAIILDPKVGDIGVCVFADKDISSVQINKKVSNPGSYRRFDMADGIYLFGVLNGTPTQYVQFVNNGSQELINIVSPAKITITAPEVDINASTKLNIVAADTIFTGQVHMNGKRVDETHTHSDPQGGNTGPVN
jgi:hypothetical protein